MMPALNVRLEILKNARAVVHDSIHAHCRECESREIALAYLDLVYSNAVEALTAQPLSRRAAAAAVGSGMRAAT